MFWWLVALVAIVSTCSETCNSLGIHRAKLTAEDCTLEKLWSTVEMLLDDDLSAQYSNAALTEKISTHYICGPKAFLEELVGEWLNNPLGLISNATDQWIRMQFAEDSAWRHIDDEMLQLLKLPVEEDYYDESLATELDFIALLVSLQNRLSAEPMFQGGVLPLLALSTSSIFRFFTSVLNKDLEPENVAHLEKVHQLLSQNSAMRLDRAERSYQRPLESQLSVDRQPTNNLVDYAACEEEYWSKRHSAVSTWEKAFPKVYCDMRESYGMETEGFNIIGVKLEGSTVCMERSPLETEWREYIGCNGVDGTVFEEIIRSEHVIQLQALGMMQYFTTIFLDNMTVYTNKGGEWHRQGGIISTGTICSRFRADKTIYWNDPLKNS